MDATCTQVAEPLAGGGVEGQAQGRHAGVGFGADELGDGLGGGVGTGGFQQDAHLPGQGALAVKHVDPLALASEKCGVPGQAVSGFHHLRFNLLAPGEVGQARRQHRADHVLLEAVRHDGAGKDAAGDEAGPSGGHPGAVAVQEGCSGDNVLQDGLGAVGGLLEEGLPPAGQGGSEGAAVLGKGTLTGGVGDEGAVLVSHVAPV